MSTPADSVPDSFAQQLRQARLKLGFSQSETAQALSLSRRCYQYWEKPNEFNPAPHILMQEAALARLARIQLLMNKMLDSEAPSAQ
jgi:DNA-binding XRE family transcriptional regulator